MVLFQLSQRARQALGQAIDNLIVYGPLFGGGKDATY